MNQALENDPAVDRLRLLAANAAPSISARPDLAATLLRRSRQRRTRRLRYGVGAAVSFLVAGAVAAAVFPGRGDYFREYIPSGDMEPTLQVGEQVIAGKKLIPKRGDIVVFHAVYAGQEFRSVKRVVALSGDRIACPDNGHRRCSSLVINGEPLVEPYLSGDAGAPFADVVLGPGELFTVGDERDASADSRHRGPIRGEDIIGVAVRIENQQGEQRSIPGAPARPGPEDSDVTDPRGPVAPAWSEP